MATNHTSPAKKSFCVWADEVRRVFQEVEAAGPKHAYKIAKRRPEHWQRCEEHDNNAFRLSNEVQDLATEAFVRIDGHTHCKSCGSELVETINDTNFNEAQCGPCEYQRYQSQPELLTLVEAFRQECSDQIQQYRDDLKEDFGDPDDLQEMVDYWKKRREQCDLAIAKANRPAA